VKFSFEDWQEPVLKNLHFCSKVSDMNARFQVLLSEVDYAVVHGWPAESLRRLQAISEASAKARGN
jgi:hypothetical protein